MESMEIMKRSIIYNDLRDVKLIKNLNFYDQRGFFKKLFSNKIFFFLKNNFIKEVSFSLTKKIGTIRGLHFQFSPSCEDKIVYCLEGKIFDVALDIRKKSKSFLKHTCFLLDSKKNNCLFIPKGFAHGFQSLKKNCKVLYIMSANYDLKKQGRIFPMDSTLNIKWPIKKKYISKIDKNAKKITNKFVNILKRKIYL
jgi:dTDP-4-dehydrorhamnose 3,5-epimerase